MPDNIFHCLRWHTFEFRKGIAIRYSELRGSGSIVVRQPNSFPALKPIAMCIRTTLLLGWFHSGATCEQCG
jgi:hypothetical protein